MTKSAKYKILSHTADLRLEICGKTLEELFQNAAEALANILNPRSKQSKLHPNAPNKPEFIEKIKVKAQNVNTLLVDFLNEILARSHINKAMYFVNEINIRTSDVQNIDANIRMSDVHILDAEIVSQKVRGFYEDVKAVTYHEVDIKLKAIGQKQKVFYTRLVFDI